VAFFSTAAELTRRCDQNKNDIEEIYKQGKETNAKVDQLATEVGNLNTRVGGLETKVDTLTTQVDARFDQVDKRFDQLERLLTSQSPAVDPSAPLDLLPPEHEQSIRLLESKMNLYSRHMRDHSEELERLRQLSAAHDVRFDALDGQMAEVLEILRSKPA
jgi:outer membrane murein-binding lipoprotein Lpp